MKKNIVKIFVLSFALIIGVGTGLSAQNFHSTPVAVKNLADEAKFLANSLPSLEETDAQMHKVNKEKLRFVKSMLKSISRGSSVEQAANAELPKDEWNVLQPSVKFIDVSFANTTPNKYIRSEILFLISY